MEQIAHHRLVIIATDLAELKRLRLVFSIRSAEVFTASNPETGIRLIQAIRQPIHEILITGSVSTPGLHGICELARSLQIPVFSTTWSTDGTLIRKQEC